MEKGLPARNDSGCVSVDDEPCEGLAGRALGIGVGSGQDEVEAGDAAVRDPGNVQGRLDLTALMALDHTLVEYCLRQQNNTRKGSLRTERRTSRAFAQLIFIARNCLETEKRKSGSRLSTFSKARVRTMRVLTLRLRTCVE